ncbi:MAG: DUF1918 domain-containing protein [Propionicimonas sp.]|uniref:DUF1918 domain-containing protein n=1 Tax=Propionicimonas sp. TaxID=1955623 RepID=UPI002B218CAC|nr:DUF1918 domain-containing protein [Propionicimonas sp.]MEA4945816.1 DUF1918 domain-containing protein [Propionicimonas sp.]MEA5119069.1 DUF1918 domain-containing protein [Propionicimonas sp.]
MQAFIGDQVVLHGNKVGAADRRGVVTEVRGQNGGPPYVVRFEDGHTTVVFPGTDCEIKHS